MNESNASIDRLSLWNGAVIATVAHAIAVAADPMFSYELSWDGINYNRQDGQGTRGTVTFATAATVAVFRDEHSPRLPVPAGNPYDLEWFFRGMPDDLRSLAQDEALQYILDEHNGAVAPLITAAFWGHGSTLTAAEPWPEVFKHGAHLIDRELLEPDRAIQEWASYHGLSSPQTELLQTLYTRRVQEESGTNISLNEQDYRVLISKGDEDIAISQELLAAVGIQLNTQ